MESLIDNLEFWVARKPAQCLFSFLDGDGRESEHYSYDSFDERTRFLAEYFTSELGLRFGERVLLAYPPGLEIIAAFFACVRIGAIPVPTYPPTMQQLESGLFKLSSTAEDCGASVALTTLAIHNSLRQRVERKRASANADLLATAMRLRWIATDELSGRTSGCIPARPNPVLFLQYTSGSTSEPKGVIVSHENVICNARSAVDYAPIGVSWLPQSHDMGLIGYYLFPLIMGGTTFGIAPLNFLKRPLAWLQIISRERATYSSAPNFAFQYCLLEDKLPTADLVGLDLSSLRVLMNAAEPVRADTFEKFFDRFAPFGLQREAHVVAYGLAENTLAATLYGTRTVRCDKRMLQRGRVRVDASFEGGRTGLALVSCGRPLPNVHLRIVDPKSHCTLGDGRVGEIWLAGPSVCLGYWQRSTQSEQTFANLLANCEGDQHRYLRTGDLGFIHEGELFVCGRIKDVIVIRGVNYFPQDIEHVVESVSPKIRRGGVVAVAAEGATEALAIIAEVESARDVPDPETLVHAISAQFAIVPQSTVLVPPGSIIRTTSGKVSRALTRRQWLRGELRVLARLDDYPHNCAASWADTSEQLRHFLRQLAPQGQEDRSLADLGIDSLTLVELIELVRVAMQAHGAAEWTDDIDIRLLQALSVADLLSLVDAPNEFGNWLRGSLQHAQLEHEVWESKCMRQDAHLEPLHVPELGSSRGSPREVLLTGATGFLGRFLLLSLLRETSCRVHVLVRAASAALATERLRASLQQAGVLQSILDPLLEGRVDVICGDLSRPHLGLPFEQWTRLAAQVDSVIHNAALVNYVFNYRALKPHNVDSTRELLKFSATEIPKSFNLISSTFIFGWTSNCTLCESDCNPEMANLDFGYAQSKWVAEQLVFAAQQQGLVTRIFRPSLISASQAGAGSGDDIAVRMLAFMINHGVAVEAKNQVSFLPADIAAENISAIFKHPEFGGSTLHVTADGYYSLMDVTRLLSRDYGYRFKYYDVPAFVVEMNRRCGKNEPLYPLLEFFNRAHTKISRMENKRYDNTNYRAARAHAGTGRIDPSLEQVVAALVMFMSREGLIVLPSGVAATGRACR
jgi:thioester reductase-like protein